MSSAKVQLKQMESRKKKPLSELSYSDSELDMIDWDASSLPHHSHFFAPSGHPHNRYSTPLILISPGHGGSMDSSRSSGGGGGVGGAAATNTQTSSGSSSGAPSPGPFPHSTSRSKLIVPPPAAAMNGHFEGEEEEEGEGEGDKRRPNGDINGWPRGRLYVNKDSLAHDLSFLANMPELCDVTFLVGEDRQPICAVRAILAARSR